MDFPNAWRWSSPKVPAPYVSTIPESVLEELVSLATRLSAFSDKGEKAGLETFKARVCSALGRAYSESSSGSWTHTDLVALSNELSLNPPLLIEAYVTAAKLLTDGKGQPVLVDPAPINVILERGSVGFVVRGDSIVLRGGVEPDISPAPTLIEQSNQELAAAWTRAEELLGEGQNREAVTAIWWVVESVLTVFKGRKVGSSVVEGAYFNEILKSLKKAAPNTFIRLSLSLSAQLQELLSDPKKAAVRHGGTFDMARMSPREARLLIDLAKAFARFFCAEYEAL
jgi:hypothetical protein